MGERQVQVLSSPKVIVLKQRILPAHKWSYLPPHVGSNHKHVYKYHSSESCHPRNNAYTNGTTTCYCHFACMKSCIDRSLAVEVNWCSERKGLPLSYFEYFGRRRGTLTQTVKLEWRGYVDWAEKRRAGLIVGSSFFLFKFNFSSFRF